MKLKWRSLFRSPEPPVENIARREHSGTAFLDLSNDLLYEFFDYLSYDEILHSFGNLNAYIDQLIERYPHSIDFQIHEQSPTHIRALKLRTSQHLLAFDALQPFQLASLRAITLGNVRPRDVLAVFDVIPSEQIEYVYLGVCAIDPTHGTSAMLAAVQNRILSLGQQRLKQCYLKERVLLTVADLPDRLPSLEYLQLVACPDLLLISQLLLRTSHLRYLNVSTLHRHPHPWQANRSSLTSLCLRPHLDCSVEDFRAFLSECCSKLQKLVVELYIYRGKQPSLLGNRHQWQTMLPGRLEDFHLKSLPSSSVHLSPPVDDPRKRQPSLTENFLLRSGETEERYCRVRVDGPLVSAWLKDD